MATQVELKKPTFLKIDNLKPNDVGVNLNVKVVSVKPKLDRLNLDGSRTRINEAVVGDETGCVVFTVRGENQIDVVDTASKKKSVLIIRNGKIEMFHGFMRLAVDRWGRLQEVDGSDLSGDINTDNNKSSTEYELVDPNKEH
jgi:replication factor A1